MDTSESSESRQKPPNLGASLRKTGKNGSALLVVVNDNREGKQMNGGITGVENFGKTTALADVFENGPDESHECDGCGQIKPDVDVWARNEETGEEIWLCVACVEW